MDALVLGGFAALVLAQVIALVKITSTHGARLDAHDDNIKELQRIHPRKPNPGLTHTKEVVKNGCIDERTHKSGHLLE